MPRRLALIHEWLRERLASRAFTVTPASSDASFRRYFRVRSGEQTWIVMDAPPQREDCAPFVQVSGLLREAGLNAPAVIEADLTRGLLLLTDLGGDSYLDHLDGQSVDGLYGDALGALATMQARVPADDLPDYDAARLGAEMALFQDWLLDRHLGVRLAPAAADLLAEAQAWLCRAAMAQPQVFVHRDYHSRNLMLCPQHNPGILDFQDAVRGPVTYDLVSLLRDAYVAWPAARVDAWVTGYHDLAHRHGILADDDPGRFLDGFDRVCAQRQLKVAGIFCRLWLRDGKPGYLSDIPRVLGYLREACARQPRLHPLGRLLEDLDLEPRLETANAAVQAGRRSS